MYDLIVIGAGAAGMTAALYALRGGKSVLLLEKGVIGGQITDSPRVENFPSIKEISGLDFSTNLFNQISELGCEFVVDEVLSLTKENNQFIVTTEDEKYTSIAVVIASGVHHRHINIPSEDKYIGKGISYCAVCDGAFYKGQDVSVIGGGNTALQYALLLSNYAKSVTVCNRSNELRAEDILIDQIKGRENIKVLSNVDIQEFTGNDKLEKLIFKNTKTNEQIVVETSGCFVAIGQTPHNEIFKELAELDERGFIIVNNDNNTKTPGLFAAGDCTQKKVRQLTTAVSDGTICGLNATNYIDVVQSK